MSLTYAQVIQRRVINQMPDTGDSFNHRNLAIFPIKFSGYVLGYEVHHDNIFGPLLRVFNDGHGFYYINRTRAVLPDHTVKELEGYIHNNFQKLQDITSEDGCIHMKRISWWKIYFREYPLEETVPKEGSFIDHLTEPQEEVPQW